MSPSTVARHSYRPGDNGKAATLTANAVLSVLPGAMPGGRPTSSLISLMIGCGPVGPGMVTAWPS